MSEFERIARYLRPLAGEGAMELRDDAARVYGRVLTKDVLVEGTHFLESDPIDLLARKALRVNASDLIAKGAKPEAYMLGLVWPEGREEAEFAGFCEGLKVEQQLSGLKLLGGDTTRGPCLVISVTMFGQPLTDQPILRSGGEAGDTLYVSGSIGDGLLGLEAARRGEDAPSYHLPPEQYGLEKLVAAHAKASLDVSDGLVADARHLAEESGVAIRIDAEAVPLSDAGLAAKAEGRHSDLLAGGDDYRVLMLAPAAAEEVLRPFFLPIGLARAGATSVSIRHADGTEETPEKDGWDHFRP